MYTIADSETGRYLSCLSVPKDEHGKTLYVTFSGKIGPDFFTYWTEAEKVFNSLSDVVGERKVLSIIEIDPNTLSLGEQFVEVLNL